MGSLRFERSFEMIRPPRKPLPARPEQLGSIVDASNTALTFARMIEDRILDWRRATEMSESRRDSAPYIVQREVFECSSCNTTQPIPRNVVDLEWFCPVCCKDRLITPRIREAIQDFDRSG